MRIDKTCAALLFLCATAMFGQSPASPGGILKKDAPATTKASGSQQSPLTKEQGEEILNELRLIRQALEDLHRDPAVKAQPPATVSSRVRASVSPEWHAMGRADAPVTLVEFTDYQCPFCRRFESATFPELKRNYIDTGKVRFVSRDLPLPFHADAASAAMAVRCAGAQGKYWEMRAALIGGEPKLGQANLYSDAEGLRLDMDAYQACTKGRQFSLAIQQDAADAQTLGITGTPGFIVGRTDGKTIEGARIDGAQPYSAFAAAIDGALAGK